MGGGARGRKTHIWLSTILGIGKVMARAGAGGRLPILFHKMPYIIFHPSDCLNFNIYRDGSQNNCPAESNSVLWTINLTSLYVFFYGVMLIIVSIVRKLQLKTPNKIFLIKSLNSYKTGKRFIKDDIVYIWKLVST